MSAWFSNTNSESEEDAGKKRCNVSVRREEKPLLYRTRQLTKLFYEYDVNHMLLFSQSSDSHPARHPSTNLGHRWKQSSLWQYLINNLFISFNRWPGLFPALLSAAPTTNRDFGRKTESKINNLLLHEINFTSLNLR